MKKFFICFTLIFSLLVFGIMQTNNSKILQANENCVEIDSVEDFLAIKENSTKEYMLMCDLDFAGITSFCGIENFCGKFYGNNYALKNITIYSTQDVALFKNLSGAFVSNLVIDSFKGLTSGSCAVVSLNAENSTLQNVSVLNSFVSGAEGCISTFCLNLQNCAVQNIAISHMPICCDFSIFAKTQTNCTIGNYYYLKSGEVYFNGNNFVKSILAVPSAVPTYENLQSYNLNEAKIKFQMLISYGFVNYKTELAQIENLIEQVNNGGASESELTEEQKSLTQPELETPTEPETPIEEEPPAETQIQPSQSQTQTPIETSSTEQTNLTALANNIENLKTNSINLQNKTELYNKIAVGVIAFVIIFCAIDYKAIFRKKSKKQN